MATTVITAEELKQGDRIVFGEAHERTVEEVKIEGDWVHVRFGDADHELAPISHKVGQITIVAR